MPKVSYDNVKKPSRGSNIFGVGVGLKSRGCPTVGVGVPVRTLLYDFDGNWNHCFNSNFIYK